MENTKVATVNVNMDGLVVKEYKSVALNDISGYIKACNDTMINATSAMLLGIAYRIAKIDENKSYKEDGFKSGAQFLMSEFGYKKTMAYNMVKVGKEFFDEDGHLKESFIGYNFGQLLSLVNKGVSCKQAESMIESSMLNNEQSCREIEEAVKEFKSILTVEEENVNASVNEEESVDSSAHEEKPHKARKAIGHIVINDGDYENFYSITELVNTVKSLAKEKGTPWLMSFEVFDDVNTDNE